MCVRIRILELAVRPTRGGEATGVACPCDQRQYTRSRTSPSGRRKRGVTPTSNVTRGSQVDHPRPSRAWDSLAPHRRVGVCSWRDPSYRGVVEAYGRTLLDRAAVSIRWASRDVAGVGWLRLRCVWRRLRWPLLCAIQTRVPAAMGAAASRLCVDVGSPLLDRDSVPHGGSDRCESRRLARVHPIHHRLDEHRRGGIRLVLEPGARQVVPRPNCLHQTHPVSGRTLRWRPPSQGEVLCGLSACDKGHPSRRECLGNRPAQPERGRVRGIRLHFAALPNIWSPSIDCTGRPSKN